MITKRAAIVAMFSGVLAKMAHADEAPQIGPGVGTVNSGTTSSLQDFLNKPTVWNCNLDQMAKLVVFHDGKQVTITPAEIFAALSQGGAP